MNQTSDLDRLLDDWLTDGPNRAPDQPIIAASQFARTHPRRPDPLRIFRSDPMADRRRTPFGVQPGLVFALLALVVAIVAAGVIGHVSNGRSSCRHPTVSRPRADPDRSRRARRRPPASRPRRSRRWASTRTAGDPPWSTSSTGRVWSSTLGPGRRRTASASMASSSRTTRPTPSSSRGMDRHRRHRPPADGRRDRDPPRS